MKKKKAKAKEKASVFHVAEAGDGDLRTHTMETTGPFQRGLVCCHLLPSAFWLRGHVSILALLLLIALFLQKIPNHIANNIAFSFINSLST